MGEMGDLRVSGGKINGADVVDGAVDRLIVKSLGASTDPSGPGSVSSAHVGLRDRARRAMEGLGGASGPLPWSSHDGRAAFWFTEGDRQDLRTEVFNASVRTATRMRRFVVSASSAGGCDPGPSVRAVPAHVRARPCGVPDPDGRGSVDPGSGEGDVP